MFVSGYVLKYKNKWNAYLLVILLATLALPTAVKAEEFAELKPINPHSYLKSSLRRGKRKVKIYHI